MRYWILQVNPGRYRIFDALHDAKVINKWAVRRYRNEISPGDRFALWVAGREGGIYAFGLITEPAVLQPEVPDPYWEGPAYEDNYKWLIGIKIERILAKHIPRSEIVADPDLAAAAIIRTPWAGNPHNVSDIQWNAICSHIKE